jgi:hypothetical protein
MSAVSKCKPMDAFEAAIERSLSCTAVYHLYNLQYSSSVTGSHHSLEAFSPAISTAR